MVSGLFVKGRKVPELVQLVVPGYFGHVFFRMKYTLMAVEWKLVWSQRVEFKLNASSGKSFIKLNSLKWMPKNHILENKNSLSQSEKDIKVTLPVF